MAKAAQPLNEEQRRLAEQYHNLIFTFLNKNALSEDEWYDIAAIGYIKAIRYHQPERPYPISSLAFKCMRDEMINEYRRQNRQKRKAILVSLDMSVGENGVELHEIVAEYQSAEDDYFMLDNIRQRLWRH